MHCLSHLANQTNKINFKLKFVKWFTLWVLGLSKLAGQISVTEKTRLEQLRKHIADT